MKKLFTISIASLMISMAIFNACSKSSDTPAATTNNNNNNNNTAIDTDYITIDGNKLEFLPNPCSLSGGSSNLYTMSSNYSSGGITFIGTTYGIPAAGTYNVVMTIPNNATTIQLQLGYGATGAQTIYTANGGTATVTIGTNPARTLVQFSSLSFVKTGSPTKTASGNMLCQ